MRYTISDLHFGHANIIDYCLRPFRTKQLCEKCQRCHDAEERNPLHMQLGCPDVHAMDEALIANWNSVVTPEDEVFELGDTFFHKDPAIIHSILSRLNGKIYHINGNHDKWLVKNPELGKRFEWVKDYFELKHNKTHFVMFHFPIAAWHKAHHGSIHIHGHEHGNHDEKNIGLRRIDIGTDPQKYFPVSLDNVIDRMRDIPAMNLGHHSKEM